MRASNAKPRHSGLAAGRAGKLTLLGGALALLLVAAACGGSTASGAGQAANLKVVNGLSKKYAGQTINVLLPPWGAIPQPELAKFTRLTGIKVNVQSLAFDDIHNKIGTAEAAGTAPADITEVDWTWAGQFGAAGWYTNLDSLLPKSLVNSSFVSADFRYNSQQVAMPYNSDLRGTYINMKDFREAGITTVPVTWAQLLADAKQIKAKGIVQYPIAADFSDIESTTFFWYMLIRSAGGNLLTHTGQPAFTAPSSPGYQALAYLQTLYKDGLVPPGAVTWDNNVADSVFEGGTVAILLAESPAALPAFLTPSQSKVAKDDVIFIPSPGADGHQTGSFALPEGMGIPKQSTHKQAAAMFIEWWHEQPQLLYEYLNPSLGDLPPTKSAISYLASHNELADGSTVLRLLPFATPLFPGGTPPWYPTLSNDVSTMIQSVMEGHATVRSGLGALAGQIHVLSSSGT